MKRSITPALAAAAAVLVLLGCGHRAAKSTPASSTAVSKASPGAPASPTDKVTTTSSSALFASASSFTAKDILAKTAAVYKSAKSFKLKGAQTQSMSMGKNRQEQRTDIDVRFERPNRLRMQMSKAGQSLLIVSTGDKRTVFDSKTKQYMIGPGIKDIREVTDPSSQGISSLSLLGGADFSSVEGKAKIVGSEKINGVDTYVITYPAPIPPEATGVSGTEKLWIGKTDFLVHQLESIQTVSKSALEAHSQGKQKPTGPLVVKSRTVLSMVAVNPSIPASEFRFRPPTGAKLFTPPSAPKNQANIPKPPDTTGKKAPDFKLTSLDGKETTLSSFRGKPVVVVFWTSMSGSAKDGMISLAKAQGVLKSKGVPVVAVTLDNNKEVDEKFVKENGIEFPVLMGYDAAHDAAVQFGLLYLPTAFIVDGSGVIKGKASGADLGAELQTELSKIGGK